MFTLNTFIKSIDDVPSDWVFENYLELPEKLTGQRIQMKSLFNLKDTNPSMYIYYAQKEKRYKFKCFSTGMNGHAVHLMMHMWQVDFNTAKSKIISEYEEFIKSGSVIERKDFANTKWIVSNYEFRKWTQYDAAYWTKYNISSNLLEKYCVRPIKWYTMTKVISGVTTTESFTISHLGIYAYMTQGGSIYKLYQPEKTKRKFLKLAKYIQGSEQLEGKRFLVITSSLKDCMALKSIPKLNIDVIAPDSENSILSAEDIEKYKKKYEAVVTYMDSDQPGVDSMQYYLSQYNLPFCYMPLEKDFSDIICHFGIRKALYALIPVLDRAIAKYKELNLITES